MEKVQELLKDKAEAELEVIPKKLLPANVTAKQINNLEKMGRVVDGLGKLEDIVKREEQAANTNRGGVEVNKYSI